MANSKRSDAAILGRLLLEARPYWPHLFGLLLLDLLSTPLSLLAPIPLKIAVDSVLGDGPLPGFLAAAVPGAIQQSPQGLLVFAAVLLVAVTALTRLNGLVQSVFSAYTSGRITVDFRSKLFWHGQRLSLGYHDAKGVSHALYRVEYDALAIRWVAIDGLIPMLSALVAVGSMILVIALINLELAIVALIVVPAIVFLIMAFRVPLRRGWNQQHERANEAMSVITEVFSSLRVVKAFVQEAPETRRYADRAGKSLVSQLQITKLQGVFNLLTGLVTAAGTGIVLYVGITAIQSGVMTVGDLLVVMAYLGLLYAPLQVIGNQLAGMQKSLASAERAFEFLDERADVPESSDPKSIQRARGEFELHDVSFGYVPGQPVLRNVALKIPAGTRVGIAGKTGAGKTTLVSLLMRFYDPVCGTIRLDGVDLKDYRVEDLRKQYGIVLQEPVLFSNSIAENIAYGCTTATREQIVEAAQAANAHEFIEALSAGYETLVGERGMRLSGGERQRIALARAFLRNAPVLLLDEPTSAVDLKTEGVILEAMDRLMRGRTSFMITHRPGTLENCDLLLHIADGRVTVVKHGDSVLDSGLQAGASATFP